MMTKLVKAVYRCRHCGVVYTFGEFDAGNLVPYMMSVGLSHGERVLPISTMAAMWDIHTCDACVPKLGVADLVGWEP